MQRISVVKLINNRIFYKCFSHLQLLFLLTCLHCMNKGASELTGTRW